MAKGKDEPVKLTDFGHPEIKARVRVEGSHVGTIECTIPGDTPVNDRHRVALRAAGRVRGITESETGIPQFGGSTSVEFLEG